MTKTLGQLSAAVIEQVERMCGSCDVDVVRFLNSAQLELALDTSKLKSAIVTVAAGEGDVPNDCFMVDQVFFGGKQIPRNVSDSQSTERQVQSVCWFVADNKLKILPEASGNYEILYVASPRELDNDTDVPSIANADDFLIAFATWKSVAAIEGATDRTAYWHQETERERALWKKIDEKDNYRPRFMKHRPWI